MNTNHSTTVLIFCLLFSFLSHTARSQDQQLTKKQKKNRYENRFGQEEEQVRTASQAARFGESVLRKVRRSHLSNIRNYAHDRLHSVLEEFDNHPKCLEIRIKIFRIEQSENGFEYARNENIIELLRKKLQVAQGASKQLQIIHRIIGAHSNAAHHALRNKEWDKAHSEYERVKQISNNFDGINQADTADSMIQLINKRKTFEQKTSERIQQAVENPDNQSINHKAGMRLAQLKRWSHALTFLQKAHGENSSNPLLHAVQIALTYHLQRNHKPEILGKYILQIDNIRKQFQKEELIRICLEIGSEIYSKIDEHREDLTKTQKDQINSILQSWKTSLQEIGLNRVISLSEEKPQNLFFPRDGLELHVPANGNSRDYSIHNRQASLRKGARVNRGAGILGALEFIGVTERWKNSLVFEQMDGSLYSRSFTVAFWFNRKQAVPTRVSRADVANVMFSLRGGNRDRIQIGTTRKFIQVHLLTQLRNPVLKVNAGIASNNWYHLALTYDANRRREAHLYLNGQLAKKWSYPKNAIRATKGRLAFGNTSRRPAPFIGRLDDLYFYHRTLTAQEVSELYNRPK